MSRNEDGFTLVELVVVLVVMAILTAVAFGFSHGSAGAVPATPLRSANIQTAVPAIEAYRADTGTYAGMTLVAILQSQLQPRDRRRHLRRLQPARSTYCVSASVADCDLVQGRPERADHEDGLLVASTGRESTQRCDDPSLLGSRQLECPSLRHPEAHDPREHASLPPRHEVDAHRRRAAPVDPALSADPGASPPQPLDPAALRLGIEPVQHHLRSAGARNRSARERM